MFRLPTLIPRSPTPDSLVIPLTSMSYPRPLHFPLSISQCPVTTSLKNYLRACWGADIEFSGPQA
jgi:hypothetical protein